MSELQAWAVIGLLAMIAAASLGTMGAALLLVDATAALGLGWLVVILLLAGLFSLSYAIFAGIWRAFSG